MRKYSWTRFCSCPPDTYLLNYDILKCRSVISRDTYSNILTQRFADVSLSPVVSFVQRSKCLSVCEACGSSIEKLKKCPPPSNSDRKKSVKKIRNIHKKTSVSESFFFFETLLEKRLWYKCFSVSFVKFLRTPFLQNTSGRLLLLFTEYINIGL